MSQASGLADEPVPGSAIVDKMIEKQSDYELEPRFIASRDLIISCGCVPVDPVARKIAILTAEGKGYTQLPKGRKNIGEDLHASALRETYEETGIRFKALPLRTATRSTPTPSMAASAYGLNLDKVDNVTTSISNCEPSSICTYRCQHTLAFKLVFWFAAQGDSTIRPDEGTKEPWEQDLKLEWVDAREAPSRMSFAADGKVIEKVLSDMRASGYDI